MVDASEWGIGLVVGKSWAAWKLCRGWRAGGRDMGWAETLAVELIVLWIVHDSHLGHDIIVKIRSINLGVISAGRQGRSRNPPCNESICRVSTCLISTNTIQYVKSAENRADPISRGKLGPLDARLDISFELPSELNQFIVIV